MIRWMSRARRIWTPLSSPTVASPLVRAQALCVGHRTQDALQSRFATTSTRAVKAEFIGPQPSAYDVFNRVPFPEARDLRRPEHWVAILENALPPHLRQTIPGAPQTTLTAVDVAEILLAAQRSVTSEYGVDLLYYMGVHEGRWQAVVWLVKQLVENFAIHGSKANRLAQTIFPWSNEGSLDALTSDPVDLRVPMRRPEASSGFAILPTLSDLTDSMPPEDLSRTEILQRGVLGQIWRSLSVMILSCADNVVKPEILEIIAYLHHQEVMPASIYSQRPGTDENVIQQPPTLHLLSSRILTSLSDAAWRAHERDVVAEATLKGGRYVALRPEIPGMAYRVHVAGLRPEIWLELILWSCLHGGWVLEGAAVLRAISQRAPEWRPLSWRSMMPLEHTGLPDWDKLEYMFNNRSSATMDPPEEPEQDVRRTISSEVVNAYIDALLTVVDVGVGDRGASSSYILTQLNILKRFLDRSGLELDGGSWDAAIIRFVESQASDTIRREDLRKLAPLTLASGTGSKSHSTRGWSKHTLDGSASFVGLCHRVLRSEVRAGNVEGALRVFKLLQDHTDANKRQSLLAFFQSMQQAQAPESTVKESGLFTGNYASIDYPSCDPQIPPTILGPFLELITDAGAYDLGAWLLQNEEVDGPLIPERLYHDQAIAPALVNFATMTGNQALLARVIDLRAQHNTKTAEGPTLPNSIMQSFLETQFKLRRWDAATRLLNLIRETTGMHWNLVNLSVLAHQMLLMQHRATSGDTSSEQDLAQIQTIFSSMVMGQYTSVADKGLYKPAQITMLLTVMATIHADWTKFCLGLQSLGGYHTFQLPVKSFNLILDGVAKTHGSEPARRLLQHFWPDAVRRAQLAAPATPENRLGASKLPRFRPKVLDSAERQRTVVHLAGERRRHVVLYGGLQPDISTISVVLRQWAREAKGNRLDVEKAPQEAAPVGKKVTPEADDASAVEGANDTPTSPYEMVIWAVECLQQLGMPPEDICNELGMIFAERELQDLRVLMPDLFRQDEEAEDVEKEGRAHLPEAD